jgi:glutamate-1-semialdehyde aminotransferase
LAIAADGGQLQALIAAQLGLMTQQLALLTGASSALSPQAQAALPQAVQPLGMQPQAALPRAAPAASAPAAQATAPSAVASASPAATPGAEEDGTMANGMVKYEVKKAFGAIARIHAQRRDEVTPKQRARLDAFIRRYTTRTAKSKEFAQTSRSVMADPRVVTGFRPLLKELVYPIVVDKSRGSKVWDLDGNEYVDALNGFGLSLFGWQPEFVTNAIRNQLDNGHEIGPQHPLTAETAELVCEFTGFDRAGFCNTGSEAVMGCMRIARTVTGRSKIALFTGSYHGIFDEVVVRGTKKLRSIPAAPGILPNAHENVLVLDYGTPESMEILKAHASELAAVLVEPIQSRRPDFRPKEFLKELREWTEKEGIVLIFDEVVCGFRVAPGGSQEYYGIQADLASYGKVVGGGLPIGIIAGKRRFMDALDGGHWQFGDDSTPPAGVTYFAGTFVRHPLAIASARAVMLHLKEQGPDLQRALNAKVEAFASRMRAFVASVDAPIEIKQFSSLWRMVVAEDHAWGDLLCYMMRERGVHIWDGFPCFFTTAHSDEDFARIEQAFQDSVRELQEGGFLPGKKAPTTEKFDPKLPPTPGARLGRDGAGNPAWFVPHPDRAGQYVPYEPS